jgi:predicted metal-dependent phosphoesterase TrpH
MGLADLHIHTTYSWDGTCSVSAILKQAAHHAGLDVIAITDHDAIQGALDAMALAPSYSLEVVPGIEVSTADGHVLALYIEELIPRGLSLVETVLRVGELGGLCIAPHPMARGTSSLSAESIREALRDRDVAQVLVGIEAFNGGLVYRSDRSAIQALAEELPLAHVANSDAHLLHRVGQGASFFPGNSARQLRRALIKRQTRPIRCEQMGLIGLVSGWVPSYLLRMAGWVAWNPNPEAPIRFGRKRAITARRPESGGLLYR